MCVYIYIIVILTVHADIHSVVAHQTMFLAIIVA